MYRSRSSAVSRISLLVYLLLIVYASWFPFSGWRDIGVPPLAFLSAPLPRYWTLFDVIINILGYVPFGLLAVFALYPAMRGQRAALLAVLAGTLLSLTMEAGQTWLPTRVASNLDLLTNAAGSAVGALAGWALAPSFLGLGRIHRLGQRWFRQEASAILIAIALWPLAQITPQAYLFGHGQILDLLSSWLVELLAEPVDLSESLRQILGLHFDHPWQYWLSETLIAACGLVGALLMLLCLLRKSAPRLRLILLLLVGALAAKSLALALFFAPENAFIWLTPGAYGGLFAGGMMVAGLTFAPAPIQRRLAIAALLIGLCLANLVPANHYFLVTLREWNQGRFLNFNGAAQMLALCWPLLALWFLMQPVRTSNTRDPTQNDA